VDFSKYRENFTAAVDDDFNFPKGVAVIFDFVREINREIQTGKNLQKSFYQSVKDFMIETSQNVLGILDWENLGDERNVDSKEEELINLLIEIRTEAKKSKNYALADSIRNRLAEIGITLQDTKDGVTYTIK